MATTPTQNYDFGKPAIGASIDIWGSELNSTIDQIDQVLFDLQGKGVDENWIINPDFRFSQEYGNSLSAMTGTVVYFADQWDFTRTGSGALSYERYSGALSETSYNNRTQYAAKFSVHTADGSLSSSDRYLIRQKIEGYNYANIHGVGYTLSFMVKSNRPGIYSVYFAHPGEDRKYIAHYSIISSNWEKKSIAVPRDTGGTYNFDNTIGAFVGFVLGAGSSNIGTEGAWGTDKDAHSLQANFMDTTTNEFYLTQVKLQGGSSASEYIPRPRHLDLMHCERYYEKSYDTDTVPAAATTSGMVLYQARAATTNSIVMNVSYRVPKVARPSSISVYSDVGSLSMFTGLISDISARQYTVGDKSALLVNSATAIDAQRYFSHYVVDLRLEDGGGGPPPP